MYFYANFHCFCDSNVWKCHPWKLRSRSWSTACAIMPFDGEYQRPLKEKNCIFALARTICTILTFQRFYLENLDQGHEVQHGQLCGLVVNTNLYNNDSMHFCASSHHFGDINVTKFRNQMFWSRSQVTIFALALTIWEILTFQMFYLENLGQGHKVHHLQLCHSAVNINLYNNHSMHFYAYFIYSILYHHFWAINWLNNLTSNYRSRSPSTKFDLELVQIQDDKQPTRADWWRGRVEEV